MTIRIGMIGLGLISRYYAKAITKSPQIALTAVCDLDERKRAAYARPAMFLTEDFHELLRREDVDGVVINLPNDLHFAVCKAALLAGKHVCCEKPLTLDVAEARELVELARQRNRTLLTAFHRRYNANVLSAKAAVGRRRISRIIARYLEKIEDHCGQDQWYLDPQRSGGGCIADNGPNAFDALSLFLNQLAVNQCHIEQVRKGVDMRAHVLLTDDRGAEAEVFLDWAYDGERKDLELHLEDGAVLHADMLAGFEGFKSSLDHEYEGVLADFSQRIAAGGSFGEEGLAAVELVARAYEMASAGSVEAGVEGVQHERA